MNAPRFSVIICSIDAMKFAQTSQCYEHLLADFPHEIIGIHDAKSLTEGYNRGIAQASGDILIFSHDDVIFLDPDFAQKISKRMANWDILGFAGTSHLVFPLWTGADWPYLHGSVCHAVHGQNFLSLNIYGASDWPVVGNIEALDGLCIIARREVAEAVGFDSETFDGWHLYDLDFSFSAYLSGYKTGVCCDIPYIHASASIQSTESAFEQNDYIKYAERFFLKFNEKMKPNHEPPKHPYGRVCHLSDHQALLRAWNENTFRRATIAIERGKPA
jgi:GT2 family glycosyltransferase